MPGMLTTCDLRVVDGGDDYAIGHRSGPTKNGGGWYDGEAAGLLPDLADPATLGCLLALVREAWEPRRGTDHIASTVHTSTGWGVGARVGSECFASIILPAFSSEAAALIAALEAAP
jgi:hypothetical protein